MPEARKTPGSFRDPGGFLFERDGILYRQVNRAGRADYDALVTSGLADELIDDGLLIPHREVDVPAWNPEEAYKILRPELVPFLSYPTEWSFGQLRDAALLTLELQRRAIARGLTLKDASAFNVQFLGGRPIFIDTLSFEAYREGAPWVAYRQFCQHFLAPLALMARVDVRLNALFRSYIDGVPLDLAARLLPWRTRLEPRLLAHIHLHARAQKSYAGGETAKPRPFSRNALLGLIGSLRAAVESLRWEPKGTEWAEYYGETNYSDAATEAKARLVSGYLAEIAPTTAWDLGANTGRFSRLAAEAGARTVAFDIDPACVERHYQAVKAKGTDGILPLLLDLANPTPALGWDHRERASLLERGPVDVVMALALVHHLAISNNVPLDRVAAFLKRACRHLIIEFVPKGDSQVRRLLASRIDIFDDYTTEGFEAAFAEHFAIRRRERVGDSERTLYLMDAREP
ncbi:class I SAM-dependent methyltransferase [Tundrisphaera sp. TA3]|uniref:class I SAM-dependent methyltransferase n=1 Tax=Tundrisphaera sp. TA3 TaxID=3435775 RepID=UPI003EC0C775